MRTALLTLTTCLLALPVQAQYSGGSGTADDPYQIATAEDLMLLGETPDDYDKHFILTADIDLDPDLPGGKVFHRAVIAPDTNADKSGHQGFAFNGVFEGNGHMISHLTVEGTSYLGLFGQLSTVATVKTLNLTDARITGSAGAIGIVVGENFGDVTGVHVSGVVTGRMAVGGVAGRNAGLGWEAGGYLQDCSSAATVTGHEDVGGVVGDNRGSVTHCHSSGEIVGDHRVGGLIGQNRKYYETDWPRVACCGSTSAVNGDTYVGGLIGEHRKGVVTQCYAAGAVSGNENVGGLLGKMEGGDLLSHSFSTATVHGGRLVGGLLGTSGGCVTHCYSAAVVTADEGPVGGLVARDGALDITACFWDVEVSGQTSSAGGVGRTTSEMQSIQTYQNAAWDFLGIVEDGLHEIWTMPQQQGYPTLAIFAGYRPPTLPGLGTREDPYLISDAWHLGAVAFHAGDAHYRLAASIDLSDIRWGVPVIPQFAGTFDGNDLAISGLCIVGGSYLGFFGRVDSGAAINDLSIVDANIVSTGHYAGALAGYNDGDVKRCIVTGSVYGGDNVGGLVGARWSGDMTGCYSDVAVTGGDCTGGLIGRNGYCHRWCMGDGGTIRECCSRGNVSGNSATGGLTGFNVGLIENSYCTGDVEAVSSIGGLVGVSGARSEAGYVLAATGKISNCYFAGRVAGNEGAGGLIGFAFGCGVSRSFWNIEASGVVTAYGGSWLFDCPELQGSKTTHEMQTATTYLEAGWDFVDETANGRGDIWWILEGLDYPRLRWERGGEPPL